MDKICIEILIIFVSVQESRKGGQKLLVLFKHVTLPTKSIVRLDVYIERKNDQISVAAQETDVHSLVYLILSGRRT
jgi:hypothetical protein